MPIYLLNSARPHSRLWMETKYHVLLMVLRSLSAARLQHQKKKPQDGWKPPRVMI